MNEYLDTIVNRAHISDKHQAAFTRQITPLEGSLYKVRTAYEIAAYSHCKNADYQMMDRGRVGLRESGAVVRRLLARVAAGIRHYKERKQMKQIDIIKKRLQIVNGCKMQCTESYKRENKSYLND